MTAAPDDAGADAFDVPTFCRRHMIGKAHFYNLVRAKRGPRLMKVGSRTLITREAAAEWRQRMEASTMLGFDV